MKLPLGPAIVILHSQRSSVKGVCVTINRCFIVLCIYLRVTKDCGEIYCDCFVTGCNTRCSRIHHTASLVQLLSNV